MINDVLAAIRASKRDPIRISSHSSALFYDGYVRIRKNKNKMAATIIYPSVSFICALLVSRLAYFNQFLIKGSAVAN